MSSVLPIIAAPAAASAPGGPGASRPGSARTLLQRFPLAGRFVLLLVLPAALLAGWAAWHLRQALPEAGPATQGVAGLGAPARIVRDANGVPHISGANERDAFFAVGYAQAQDRLWQLEVQRRIASGRLSEVFGSSTLQQDTWLRTLGLPEAARASWNALDPQARDSLQAYADGVNAFLAGHPTLPPEFALFDIKPEPWTVYDSLAWVKVFALELSGNFNREIAHHLASQRLTPAQLATFFGPPREGAEGGRVVAAAGTESALAGLYATHRSLESTLRLGGRFVGSNAWAVSGRLAQGGHALLANDPHLGLQIPSLWYPVSMQGGALQTAGMALVGLPVVIFGRNAHVAWGGTNLPADVQDLYFEEVDPRDVGRYRVGDHWERFATRTESIGVKAAFPAALREPLRPVRVVLRSSRHGPVITDAMGGLLSQPVALRWTALDPDDTTYQAFYDLGHARDWTTFRAALRLQVAPALNMLYADDAGHIGFAAAGRVPLRRSGDGSAPSQGGDGAHDWDGAIPPERMPAVFDPPDGLLVSANDDGLYRGTTDFFSGDWASPGRAERIAQLLRQRIAGGSVNATQMAAMQLDTLSLPAARFATRLARLPARDERESAALARLARWDGSMAVDSVGASVFNAWLRHLREKLFLARLTEVRSAQAQAGLSYLQGLVEDLSIERIAAALDDPDHAWCDASGPQGCEAIALDALDAALADLAKLAGSDMDGWAWGRVHRTVYEHMPLSRMKVLDTVFGRRLASGGSPDTIAVANAVFDGTEGYRQTFGAGFRQVIALAPAQRQASTPDASEHLFMNSTGESGNAFSAHYADMVAPFGAGRMDTLSWGAPVAQAGSLGLVPVMSPSAAP